jgi:hypothetical protein
MKRYNYIILKTGFILLLVILIINQSCDNYVDVKQPNSQLIKAAVFEDVATANAAMGGLYAKMRNNGMLSGSNGMSFYTGLYADELDWFQTVAISHFYNNTLTPGESGVTNIWNNSYKQIYEANSIIEGVTNAMALPQASRIQLKGEALFSRALLHFYLMNLYGEIPYIKTTDFEQNSHVSRMSINLIYDNIIADLTESVALLPEAYVTAERVRPNRFAAKALLAKVYLYKGDYAAASNEASAVINSPLYTWETDLNKVFLKASTTTIWQFMPNISGMNTMEGISYIFNAGPPSSIALKPSFVNAFEVNDLRKVNWIRTITNGSNSWHHAYKYKQQTTTASSQEYSIVLRLAEQYLIRAEARARQGELTAAKTDLNLIRNTAGLPNSIAVTDTDIINDIMNQRRFELFTEFGNRFFDLKRSGQIDAILTASKPGWDAKDKLWPLPAVELNVNPNLNPQNPGY